MPKIVSPLTLSQIKLAKPKEKLYKLADGGGLALWVLPSGGKSWRITYKRPTDNKSDTLTLGLYPEFSLAEARQWRDEIKGKIARGQNPKKISDDVSAKYRFENRFIEWHERWSKTKTKKYAKQVFSAIETNVLPVFKGKDVRLITTAEIVTVLRKMETRGVLEYLKRVKTSLNLLFDFLLADGTIQMNPVAVIGRQVFETAPERHFDALKPEELPLLIEKLEFSQVQERTKLLVYWQLLTMLRPGEAVSVRIKDIDTENWILHIPAERMKRRLSHFVPMSSALIQIYKEAMTLNVKGIYLFEGSSSSGHVTNELVLKCLRRTLKLNTTAHGLRALARTLLREEYQVRRDVGEMLLAHVPPSKTERSYNRSELLEERRQALEWLGEKVMKLRSKYRS